MKSFSGDSMLHEIDRVTGLINDLFTLSVKKENNRHVFPADAVLRVGGIHLREGVRTAECHVRDRLRGM